MLLLLRLVATVIVHRPHASEVLSSRHLIAAIISDILVIEATASSSLMIIEASLVAVVEAGIVSKVSTTLVAMVTEVVVVHAPSEVLVLIESTPLIIEVIMASSKFSAAPFSYSPSEVISISVYPRPISVKVPPSSAS